MLSTMQYSNTPSCSKKYMTFLRIFVILATSLLASNVFSIEDLRVSSMYALLSISPSLAHRTYYYVHTILNLPTLIRYMAVSFGRKPILIAITFLTPNPLQYEYNSMKILNVMKIGHKK